MAARGAAPSSRGGEEDLLGGAAQRGAGPGATAHGPPGADAQRAGRGAPLAVVLRERRREDEEEEKFESDRADDRGGGERGGGGVSQKETSEGGTQED